MSRILLIFQLERKDGVWDVGLISKRLRAAPIPLLVKGGEARSAGVVSKRSRSAPYFCWNLRISSGMSGWISHDRFAAKQVRSSSEFIDD